MTPSGKGDHFPEQCSRPLRSSRGTLAQNLFWTTPEKLDLTTSSHYATLTKAPFLGEGGGLSTILTQTNEEGSQCPHVCQPEATKA